MGTALRKAQKRADRVKAMNKQIDQGGEQGIAARQAKKFLANSWIRRGENCGAYHKPENLSRSAITSLDCNRRHLVTSL